MINVHFLRRASVALLCLRLVGIAGAEEIPVPVWDNPPMEVVPAVTDKFMQRLAKRGPVDAEIKMSASGWPELLVDGVVIPNLIGNLSMSPRDQLQVREWKRAGVRILAVYFDVGVYNERLGFISPRLYQEKPFWDGKERYNREQVDEVLSRAVKVYPDAYIILCLRIDTYPEWTLENPTEVMENEAGEAFIGSVHFQGVGDPKAVSEKRLWSFHSKVLQDDVAETLGEVVRTVERSPWGKRVIGYWVGGGYDGQLYFWQPPTSARLNRPEFWGDFSPPARLAWTQWLQGRYGTVEELNRAWGEGFTSWDEASPPLAKNLASRREFAKPGVDGAEIDWRRFSAEARNGLISRFAEAIRSASERKIIVGAPAGDSGARSDLTANAQLIRDANLDFFTHQAGYNHRLPPAVGGVNALLASYAANSKLFVADVDFRTWLSKPTNQNIGTGIPTITDDFVGRAKDMDQLRSMWRRELGRLWANGATAWINPLGNAWAFRDPEIRRELEILGSHQPGAGATNLRADVALIYDERSVDFLRGEAANHGRWAVEQRRQLDASGMAWSAYYLEDLIEGKVPHHKVYIFQNLLRIDDAIVQAIKRIQSDDRTLIFLQGVGYGSPELPNEVKSEVVGMTLAPLQDLTRVGGSDREEDKGSRELITRDSKLFESPGFSLFVDDPDAVVGAAYAKSARAAVGERRHENWTSVFVGSTVLSSADANRLAKKAGAWVATDAGVGIAAGNSVLMVNPLVSRKARISLPFAAELTEVVPGSITTPPGTSVELGLEAGVVHLFNVSPVKN